MSDVTRILDALAQGEEKAAEELLPLVYAELRRLAAQKMAQENPGQTLQPTALVHEAWLRLTGDENRRWNDRSHFFAAAAEAMRRILVDNARRKRAQRHGGGQQRVELNEVNVAAPGSDDELLALDEALEKLAAQNRAEAEVVKLRYFVGMTIEETADALDISVRTANTIGPTPAPGSTRRSAASKSYRTARSVWTAPGLPALSAPRARDTPRHRKSGSKLRALQTLARPIGLRVASAHPFRFSEFPKTFLHISARTFA